MKAFNEWVPTEKGKRIVQFSLANTPTFWSVRLFDIWENPEDKSKLVSFAIITSSPTQYIAEVGHTPMPHYNGEAASVKMDSNKRKF